jgi:pyridoxine 5-phosphate synthase
MTKLSVNINKIATLRNARGENHPDVLKMALLIESLGVDGITVHPRQDERHIKRADVFLLKKHLSKELNIEGYPSHEFIDLINEIRPAQVTLVPDPPHVITSNAGFKLNEDFDLVAQAIKKLEPAQSRISIFIDPKDFSGRDVRVIKDTGTHRIELYTKEFADHPENQEILKGFQDVAKRAHALSLGINAGHDLSLDNLSILLKAIPEIAEVSIGHAIICDALLWGLPETIRRYLAMSKAASTLKPI